MKKTSILILLLAIMALPLACSKGSKVEQTAHNTTQNLKNTAEDAKITLEVKSKFAADDQVPATKIEVDTENGLVTLRGTVENQAQADKAYQLASSVKDVREVRSFLKTQTEGETASNESTGSDLKEAAKNTGDALENTYRKVEGTAKDAKITAAIKMRLAKDDLVKSSDIDVDSENGHVTLNGKVSSPAEEKRAIQIARATDDVRTVHSNLTVQ